MAALEIFRREGCMSRRIARRIQYALAGGCYRQRVSYTRYCPLYAWKPHLVPATISGDLYQIGPTVQTKNLSYIAIFTNHVRSYLLWSPVTGSRVRLLLILLKYYSEK